MTSPSSSALPSPSTERLDLRPWSTADAHAVLGGTRQAHWAHDFPGEGDRVVAGLLDRNPDWLGPYGHRLVVERESGLVVGSIGLFWPPDQGTVEIGYGIVESRSGRGYATEAARALTDFALTAPGVHTVTAAAELSNPASVRVLEKAGFLRWSVENGVARFGTPAPGREESPGTVTGPE